MSLTLKIVLWLSSITVLGFVIIAAIGYFSSRVEIQKYQVQQRERNIEIRLYPASLVAEVLVSGDREQAINQGFRLLAKYIFGDNVMQQKIAMTAPVQQLTDKIAMTAPVTQQQQATGWLIRFVMPAQYTQDNLPRPRDPRVLIRQIPAKTLVVIRFRGTSSRSNLSQHEKLLLEYIHQHHFVTHGDPVYSFYNPPWTLPLFRRNEIMFELTK